MSFASEVKKELMSVELTDKCCEKAGDPKLELCELILEGLGGKDNILDTEVDMSRFKVTLKDITKANKEGIIKLYSNCAIFLII